MKFKFSLEKVLKQRHIQVDVAKKDFSEAQHILDQEMQKLKNLIDIKEASLAERTKLITTQQDWTSEVEQINFFLTGQDLRIKQQNQRLIAAENLVESKREILRETLVEAKIMDKLREKKKEEFIRSEEKKEQAEIDELTVLRFSRNESLIKGSHEDGI